jgi:hypothetical protein
MKDNALGDEWEFLTIEEIFMLKPLSTKFNPIITCTIGNDDVYDATTGHK